MLPQNSAKDKDRERSERYRRQSPEARERSLQAYLEEHGYASLAEAEAAWWRAEDEGAAAAEQDLRAEAATLERRARQ